MLDIQTGWPRGLGDAPPGDETSVFLLVQRRSKSFKALP